MLRTVINIEDRQLYTSVASIGELRSIALQNNWGRGKWNTIKEVLTKVSMLKVADSIALTYAQIDASFQHKHPDYTHYGFPTSRNMTKNNLWIAATAAFLGLKLVTTDGGFGHLHKRFFEVE